MIEPESQGRAVLQGGGRVNEGIGQKLARLLQVAAVLNGVGQDAWQQAHVLALGLHIAGFEQREVGEHEGDDAFLWFTLPLADHHCGRRRQQGKQELLQTDNPSFSIAKIHAQNHELSLFRIYSLNLATQWIKFVINHEEQNSNYQLHSLRTGDGHHMNDLYY